MSRFVGGPVLVLTGAELPAVDFLVKRGLDDLRRREQVAPPPRLEELVREIGRAANAYRVQMSAARSDSGPADADMPGGGPASTSTASNGRQVRSAMSSSEVARYLGVSPRHVTRLAGQLGGMRAGRCWVFDPDRVEAFASPQPRNDDSRSAA